MPTNIQLLPPNKNKVAPSIIIITPSPTPIPSPQNSTLFTRRSTNPYLHNHPSTNSMKGILVLVAITQAPCRGFTFQAATIATSSIQLQKGTSTDVGDDGLVQISTENKQTALSMTIDQLEKVLGGRGRARLAWDCYCNGADPAYFFGDTHLLAANSIFGEYSDKSSLAQHVLPTPRVTQTIGKNGLSLLADLHSHCGGGVENGLATLIHISTSTDGTTKLLLRLMDGFEVETVLIPFWAADSNTNEIESRTTRYATLGRTTVCISSQVGCKQGCR